MVSNCLQNVQEGISPTNLMFFGTETHSAVQPETENQNSVGGAKREAAPSYAELRASLGPALGMKKIASDPKSRFSLKAAEKTWH